MNVCKVCGDLFDEDNPSEICSKCYKDGFVKCPKCGAYHAATWVGIGDKNICEDCHMNMLGM